MVGERWIVINGLVRWTPKLVLVTILAGAAVSDAHRPHRWSGRHDRTAIGTKGAAVGAVALLPTLAISRMPVTATSW